MWPPQCRGAKLYPHLRETLLTSAVSMTIALAFFFSLGRPGYSNAADELNAMTNGFQIS
jgi:hypothetical protein